MDDAEQDNVATARNEQYQYCMHLRKHIDLALNILFNDIAAKQNFLLFGGDAKDSFAHSLAPEVLTFMMIDNQYYEWYFHCFKKKLDKSRVLPVLPVLCVLQGHPESGKLWERHINNILMSPTFNFKHTTHDCTIYQTTFKGNKVLLLQMVMICYFNVSTKRLLERSTP